MGDTDEVGEEEQTEEVDDTVIDDTVNIDNHIEDGNSSSAHGGGGRSIASVIQQRNEILNAESNAGLPTLLPRTGADIEENNINVRFIMVILLAALIQLVAVKYQKL